MPWRPAPMDPVYTPASYPGHDYLGPGEIVTVRAGREVVGHLTRQGARLGWLPRPALSEAAGAVRLIVEDVLCSFARDGRPLVDAWAECLRLTQHDSPVVAPLDGFRHPLADD
ncbi:hypothetical protein GA0070622_5311 [Micromonospora sediminicola]|uniref:Uncharacterized protein n=1 Tax=Micromonospora sediminicola TaxID=946078 RepID=A0A1A9BFC5_9ACTN|nr:hypothetical protein [Micromonospora sediminicola]SBT68215.1 hypothetical protein GA0070622_5311 [Micromonospora sediminicola]